MTPENNTFILNFENVVPKRIVTSTNYLFDFVDLSFNKVYMKNDYSKLQMVFKPRDLNFLLNFTINDISTNPEEYPKTTIYGPSLGIGYYVNQLLSGYVIYTSQSFFIKSGSGNVPGDFWTFRFEFTAPLFYNIVGVKMGYEYNTSENSRDRISRNGLFLGIGIKYHLNSANHL